MQGLSFGLIAGLGPAPPVTAPELGMGAIFGVNTDNERALCFRFGAIDGDADDPFFLKLFPDPARLTVFAAVDDDDDDAPSVAAGCGLSAREVLGDIFVLLLWLPLPLLC